MRYLLILAFFAPAALLAQERAPERPPADSVCAKISKVEVSEEGKIVKVVLEKGRPLKLSGFYLDEILEDSSYFFVKSSPRALPHRVHPVHACPAA